MKMSSIFSEEDLSQLAARQIKAEILGDAALAKKLSQQLHEARLVIKENGFAKRPLKQVNVLLTKLDSQGQSCPIETTQDKISVYKKRKTNKYFDDGSKYSLKQMFEREKITTADDQMEMFVEASVKCGDSAEIDFELRNVSKKLSQKLATGREEGKDIVKAFRREPVSEASIKEVADLDDMPSIFSEEDLSQLAARQIKAEILGDAALAKKLSQQLHEARLNIKENGFAKRPLKQVDVILTKLDSQGQSRPIQTTQDKISDYKQKKTNKYFDDGSKYSLKQMFEREKLTTADDQMEMFVEASVKCDDSAEIDFELGNVSKKLSQKLATGREEEKDIGKAIRHHQKLNAALEKCNYCLDQPRMKKHLIIDIGDQVYLCLPSYQTMIEGYCLIVPKTHVSSFLTIDEDVWREVSVFKCHLRNLFRSQSKSVLFMETSMNFKYHPHAVLECIPVPEEEGHMAPFYFKKAIEESESEWAHNKKLIDLKGKGLRHSIPKNFPYFHVEFDSDIHSGGFAHVIEDQNDFPRDFGKDVVYGMLDIDRTYLHKNIKEVVLHFRKAWKMFKDT